MADKKHEFQVVDTMTQYLHTNNKSFMIQHQILTVCAVLNSILFLFKMLGRIPQDGPYNYNITNSCVRSSSFKMLLYDCVGNHFSAKAEIKDSAELRKQ